MFGHMNCAISVTPCGRYEENISFFQVLKAAGFSHIGLEFQKAKWLEEAGWEETADSLAKAIADSGMIVSAAHLAAYPLDIGLSVKYPQIEEQIRRSVLASVKVAAPRWVAHLRSSIDQGYSKEVAAEQNAREFAWIMDLAVKNGASLSFENLPVFPDYPGCKYYSSNPNELREFVESFASDAVGICLDTGHLHMMLNDDESESIRILGDKINLIEINNNWIRFDSHMLPSAGSIDWTRLGKDIAGIGYQGDLLLEANPAAVPEIAPEYYAHGYDCMKVIKERIENA